MKIRVRVAGAAVLAFAAVAGCLVMLGIGMSRSFAADAEQEKVQRASRAVAALLAAVHDFALYGEPHAAQQWQRQHAELTLTLSSPVLSGETSVGRLALRDAADQLQPMFARLVDWHAGTDGQLAERGRELLVDQLLARTQLLADSAYRWSREAAASEQAARQRLRVAGVVALLLALAATLAQPLVVWRRVLRPLATLERAASEVERGDLSARSGSTASDEVGQLSRRFDAMTAALAQRSAELRRSEQRLRAIADHMPALITQIDTGERYTFVNAYVERMLGVRVQTLIGRPMREVCGETLYAEIEPHIRAALGGGGAKFETRVTIGGEARDFESQYIADVGEDGRVQGFYGLSFDVSERKRIEAELARLARFDTLTGLPNRRQFDERLVDAMARSRRSGDCLALLFLDIDRFKSINDSHGHAAGDAVLIEFARRLVVAVRVTDSVARLAGDEFVVILEGLRESSEAELVARKIVGAMSDSFVIGHRRETVTTSIGIALYAGSVSAAELMASADAALYAAKGAGRNRYRLAQVVEAAVP